MLLGNVAVRVGQPIEYDGERGVITAPSEAVALTDVTPRKGWEL